MALAAEVLLRAARGLQLLAAAAGADRRRVELGPHLAEAGWPRGRAIGAQARLTNRHL